MTSGRHNDVIRQTFRNILHMGNTGDFICLYSRNRKVHILKT